MKKIQEKLPDSPGVYFFLGKNRKILYIGKATSLKTRVRSYFGPNLAEKRSELIERMVLEATKIDFRSTDSVLEALILEANLIRKHLPPYNTALKDQKSWNFVVITDEDFPQILMMRERELASLLPLGKGKSRRSPDEVRYGPFTNSYELRDALKIIRKIFPYRDQKCKPGQGRPCFNRQIGLCPGVCTGEISKKDYGKIVNHIKMFFWGKKKALISSLAKEMKDCARERKFEEAEKLKWKIKSLQHIQDIALIKQLTSNSQQPIFRIEAYDIAHLSGTNVVGVMTVIEDGEMKKSDYRKFKIKIQKNDDVAALREVLSRRLNHNEWPYPDLVVVDGREPQINIARAELEKQKLLIPVVSVVKDSHHKPREILGRFFPECAKEILLANSEAHRFAINFHKKRRSKSFII